ncbi:hypothetical protein TNCV_415131 [Trichonephila clavipes]|nr:hypothetical protein TNCV_415131 [Trichonephila clavipes]
MVTGRAVLRMYQAQFPDQRMPYHRIFQRSAHYLNVTFGTRRIERGGTVPWPPQSLNLSSLDYFLWEYLKNLVHATAPSAVRISMLEFSKLLPMYV